MDVHDLKKCKIPGKPGVYFFLGKKREILYIGKATSLKSRVRSYFDLKLHEKRSLVIEKMVQDAATLEWVVTDSVLEALLLEVNLIRTHKPRYNTRSKDDKSYNHVVITGEEFPRVLIIRGKDLLYENKEGAYTHVYGPFPNTTLFRQAMKIMRKIFQFYDSVQPSKEHKSTMSKGKLDFNRQIGLYPKDCTKEEYAKTIRHIQLFFEGNKPKILSELRKQMHAYAKIEAFEKAQNIKKQIFALEHIEDVALLRDDARIYKDERHIRIEAYDIAHLGGSTMVGAMTVVTGTEPEKSQYRKFKLDNFNKPDDPKALAHVLERRLQHTDWSLPDIIVADGNATQIKALTRIVRQNNYAIPVVGVVKDDHHKPKEIIGSKKLIQEHRNSILLANAEAHRFAITFHRSLRAKKFIKK